MYTSEITRLLRNFQQFEGAFPRNRVPVNLQHFQFVIANHNDDTDTSNGHWVAFGRNSYQESTLSQEVYTEHGNRPIVEYFDPLGSKTKDILNFSYALPKNAYVLYNESPVQSDDMISCGEFVVTFVIERLENPDLSYYDLLNSIFSQDKKQNEQICLATVKNLENDFQS